MFPMIIFYGKLAAAREFIPVIFQRVWSASFSLIYIIMYWYGTVLAYSADQVSNQPEVCLLKENWNVNWK